MQTHETIPGVAADVRRLVEEHRAFYEVIPHYIIVDERPVGAAPTSQRIQDGIDVDVYGVNTARESWTAAEYEVGYRTLRQLALTVLANSEILSNIEVIPFRSTVILDTKAHFRCLSFLRISIRRRGGLTEAAGDAERLTLAEVEKHLNAWGLKAGASQT